ncbi:hypothetical protein V8C35DRAFT_318484 [Trichoderma chlorosporum]
MADFIKSKWQTSLPDTGYTITSSLINQKGVYAASNGFVHRLDVTNGKVLGSNNLPGTGYNEIRLASPPDASILIAGTAGQVFGLDSETLQTKWGPISLPGCGYDITSVLCAEAGLYAGCNGHVYLLDIQMGSVKLHNSLEGHGYHEVRLAASNEWLLVGINGYVLLLNPKDLDIKRKKSLPDCGYDIVSVVLSKDHAYAGSYGRVYQLKLSLPGSSNDWEVTPNNLSGTGYGEVRLTLNVEHPDALYVGTNGYGISLDTANFSEIYKVSLPGSAYSVTDVVVGNVAGKEVTYFANNGYIFELDQEGKMTGWSRFPEGSRVETRLAIFTLPEPLLVVGNNGYCAALQISNRQPPFDFSEHTYKT